MTLTCSHERFSEAYANLASHLSDRTPTGPWLPVWRAFRSAQWADNKRSLVHCSEQLAYWVDILSGPHWRTMIKAFEINNETSVEAKQ